MIKKEIIHKPIQIVQYMGDEPIVLSPDYVSTTDRNLSNVSLNLHNNAIVLLTAQLNEEENGVYKYNGSSLIKYYFDFFKNTKKIYKVTKDSSYIVYNGLTDKFNQFHTIEKEDVLILIQNSDVDLPYEWYSYEQALNVSVKYNLETIKNNCCALGMVFNDKPDNNISVDLNLLPSQPLVLTSEIYNTSEGSSYHVLTDIIQNPDISYKNILLYHLNESEDFNYDNNNNVILAESLIQAGLNGVGKLKDWQILYASDPNFLDNYLIGITDESSETKIYYYNTSLATPYPENSLQTLVRYPLSLHENSSNIVYEKKYLIKNNIVSVVGSSGPIYVNSSVYLQNKGTHEVRVRVYNSNMTLVSEDTLSFMVNKVTNLPTPTPTPTPSSKKHSVNFDAGPILEIDNCDDCYKDFITATVTNMSPECRYYYEFGVIAYGNPNPDKPQDTTEEDDITFTTQTGILNNGLETDYIRTLITTGIGKIRTSIYVKVINLENHVSSTSNLTIEKCDRDFCSITPTPTASKSLKSYPPRTPTKTRTPTPTTTTTVTRTPSLTPTTPLVVPNAITNLNGIPGIRSVALSWTAPANSIVRDYTIQYSLNNGSNWLPIVDGVSTSTSFTINNLTNNTEYLFRVAAQNGAGLGPYVATVESITPAASVPNAPSITSVVPGNQQTTLSWSTPFDGGLPIIAYIVEYSSNNGTNWTPHNHSTTSTTATISNLTNGTSYIYRVSAVNNIGSGEYSVYSNTSVPATVPGTPSAPNVSRASTGALNVSWGAPSNGGNNIIGYSIRYSANQGTSWFYLNGALTTANINSFNFSSNLLTLGSSYIFQVAARNNLGTGPYSSSSASNLFALVPSVPVVSAVAQPSSASISISWTNASANGGTISGFTLQSSINNGTSWSTVATTGPSSFSYVLSNVPLNQSYLFRVRADSNIGSGPYGTSKIVNLKLKGQLLAWGNNDWGQIGDGTTASRNVPQAISLKFIDIKTCWGNNAYIALTENGQIYSWGANTFGATGQGLSTGTISTPTKMGLSNNWTKIFTGRNCAGAINSSGQLYVWGRGYAFDGSPIYGFRASPVEVPRINNRNWISASITDDGIAAINEDGDLYGSNYNSNRTIMQQKGDYGYISIALNIRDGGTLYAIRNNINLLMEMKNFHYAGYTNVPLVTDKTFIKVQSGDDHHMALDTQNRLWAWGSNSDSQLGGGNTLTIQALPVRIGNNSNWTTNFSAGFKSSAAIDNTGKAYLWGRFINKNSAVFTQSLPLNINSGQVAATAVFDKFYISNKSIYQIDQISPISTSIILSLNNPIFDNDITQCSVGGSFSTAIDSSHIFYVIGTSTSYLPGVAIDKISAGWDHYLALDYTGKLWAGGRMSSFTPGQSLTNNPIIGITEQPTLTRFKEIAAGNGLSLYIDTNNILTLNGANRGSLIPNTENTITIDHPLSNKSWTKIFVSQYPIASAAAIDDTGNLYTFGDNSYGQLGIGTINNLVLGLTLVDTTGAAWVKIAIGRYHMIGLNALGEIYSWGFNNQGQLGINGSYSNQPTRIGSDSDWIDIAAGAYHSFAVKSNKQLYGWGWNASGQIGNGSNVNVTTPTLIGNSNTEWLGISAGNSTSFGIISTS